MPNFDGFERLVRQAMVARESDMSSFATSFRSIPPANRPSQFKQISESDFTAWLIRARNCLRAMYGSEATFSTSDLNSEGADLQVLKSGVQIELKTGAVTDANLGVGTIAWAMGDSDKEELNAIMDGPEMLKRRQLAQNGKSDEVRASQEATMIELEAYFRARISQGADAPAKLAHLARCVARGVTNQKDMQKLLHENEADWNAPDILHVNWTNGWQKVERLFSIGESIVIASIYRASHGDESETVGRAQVVLEGSVSKLQAKIYPNYKNSHGQGNSKVAARNWVRTPCFHVWITQA